MAISYRTKVSTALTSNGLQDLVERENEQSTAASFLLKYLPSHVSWETLGNVLEESAFEYSTFINSDFDSAHDQLTTILCDVGSPEIKEITTQIVAYNHKIDRILKERSE